MHLEELYPLKGFKITEITQTPSDKVLIKTVSTSRSATCPYCQTPSYERHSSYHRKPQALPCSDTPVQLILDVQRYFCQGPDCTRKTFAEQIPDTASFYARRTICLETVLKCIAFEMSAEAASRVCEQLNVQISADSVLRLIRRTLVGSQLGMALCKSEECSAASSTITIEHLLTLPCVSTEN
jgi:transposase